MSSHDFDFFEKLSQSLTIRQMTKARICATLIVDYLICILDNRSKNVSNFHPRYKLLIQRLKNLEFEFSTLYYLSDHKLHHITNSVDLKIMVDLVSPARLHLVLLLFRRFSVSISFFEASQNSKT
jgi:hypothetical protein